MRMPRSVRDADVAGKTVLVRSDLNVPLDRGKVADDMRIRASLPTLRLLLESGASEVRVLLAHLGRPKVGRKGSGRRTRLKPVEERAARATPRVAIRVTGWTVLEKHALRPARDDERPRVRAGSSPRGCDLYVNDAFGSAHRAPASNRRRRPTCCRAYAGPTARRG